MRRPVLAMLLAVPAMAQARGDALEASAIVRALRDELERSMAGLQLPDTQKPYFVSYRLVDQEDVHVRGSFGALVHRSRTRSRLLGVQVRVGTPSFDNSNFGSGFFMGSLPVEAVPLDDDYDALRREIWLATDRAYKQAVETLEKKRAAKQSQIASPDEAADFTRERATRIVGKREPPPLDPDRYADLARRLSAAFRRFPDVHVGTVGLSASTRRTYFVSSEGSLSYEPRTRFGLEISCRTQADDGMKLKHFAFRTTTSPDDLAQEAVLLAEVERVATELGSLRKASLADDYNGPVLFEGAAAAQLLAGLLSDNLSGTPPPRSDSPQMARFMGQRESELVGKLGRRVLPPGFRVEDDPTIDRVGGTPLIGGYAADDEGMAAQKVVLVEDGNLKGLLMSRAPRKGFEHSNGHGRGALAGFPRGRIGNLLVAAPKGLSASALRKRLMAEVEAAGLEYGLVVRLLDEPGITGYDWRDPMEAMMGSGAGPVALPRPLLLLKVGRDGREEPVRGASLAAVPLRALREIVAWGKERATYSYVASGSQFGGGLMAFLPAEAQSVLGIPSSVVAPALLLKEVELKRSTGAQLKPPLLPRPVFAGKE